MGRAVCDSWGIRTLGVEKEIGSASVLLVAVMTSLHASETSQGKPRTALDQSVSFHASLRGKPRVVMRKTW